MIKAFKKSIDFDRNFFIAAAYDLSFYLLSIALITLFFVFVLNPNLPILGEAQQIVQSFIGGAGDMEKAVQLKDAFESIRFYAILLSIVLFIAYMVIKSLVWQKINRQKFSRRNMLRFAIVNSILFFSSIIFTIASYFAFVDMVFIFVFFLIILPFSIHLGFVFNSKPEKKIKEIFAIAFKRIHVYYLTYFIMFLIFVIFILLHYHSMDALFTAPLFIRQVIFLLWVAIWVFYFTWTKALAANIR